MVQSDNDATEPRADPAAVAGAAAAEGAAAGLAARAPGGGGGRGTTGLATDGGVMLTPPVHFISGPPQKMCRVLWG